MKYLFIFLIVGIVLIGRAAYVALQIKKPEKTGKYGANPKTAILATALVGAACFVISNIGFAMMNNKSVSKTSGIEIAAPLKEFDSFTNAYNKYAEKFEREIIDDWSFTDEGNNSKVTSLIFKTGATMSIYALLESPHYVVGATYFIELTDDQFNTFQNLFRLYVLIETFESGEPEGNVIDFVQKIITSTPGKIIKSENNISYYWQDVDNDMMIYIDTTTH
jgi:hypothetical protein